MGEKKEVRKMAVHQESRQLPVIVTHHNVAPLVEFDGQVSVGLHPLCISGIHHCRHTDEEKCQPPERL